MTRLSSRAFRGAALTILVGATTAGIALPAHAHGEANLGRGTTFYLTNSHNGGADAVTQFGTTTDIVLVGDWDGDGVDTFAVRTGSRYSLSNTLAGPSELTAHYGRADDEVFVGDWDGDGTDTLAVRRGNAFYAKNSISSGGADVVIHFGRSTDEVLVGDWDGDGADTFAVRRGSTYYVKNSMTSWGADRTILFGRGTDIALSGDWDNDGKDELGLRRGNQYYLRDLLLSGRVDHRFAFGKDSDTQLVGDWDGDGLDTLAARRSPLAPTGRNQTVAGYDNGRLADSLLCPVPFLPSHDLHCATIRDTVTLHELYRSKFGARLPIDDWPHSTYRSRAQQDAVWIEIGPPTAAVPGTSPHGWGLALDIFEGRQYEHGTTINNWLRQHGPRYGWVLQPWHEPGGSWGEYWHFDYTFPL